MLGKIPPLAQNSAPFVAGNRLRKYSLEKPVGIVPVK
jgi:hypothetical protein